MIDNLEEFYENITMLSEGFTFHYNGYSLKKVETSALSPDHDEVAIINEDGNRVESFTVKAFSSYDEFKQKLDELIEYDPDDMDD